MHLEEIKIACVAGVAGARMHACVGGSFGLCLRVAADEGQNKSVFVCGSAVVHCVASGSESCH